MAIPDISFAISSAEAQRGANEIITHLQRISSAAASTQRSLNGLSIRRRGTTAQDDQRFVSEQLRARERLIQDSDRRIVHSQQFIGRDLTSGQILRAQRGARQFESGATPGLSQRQLRGAQQGTQRIVLGQERAFQQLRESIDPAARAIRELDEGQQLLSRGLSQGRIGLNEYNQGLSVLQERADNASLRQGHFAFRIQEATKAIQIALGPLSGYASRLTAFAALALQGGIAVGVLTAGIIGVGKVLTSGIRNAADFETALNEVAKTTGLSGEELEQFGERISGIRRELGFVSSGRLLEIAAAAGQAGARGQEIEDLTRVVAQLGATSDLAGEEAVRALVGITRAAGEPLENIDGLSSALTRMAANSRNSERVIANMSLNVAQAGQLFGLGAAEAVAYATQLAEVGVQAEASRSSLQRAFLAIGETIEEGGARFRNLQRITEQSGEALREAFDESPERVLRSLIEGLSSLEATQFAPALESIGLTAGEDVRAIGALAGRINELNDSLRDVAAEMENPTARLEEFERVSDSFNNQVAELRNNISGISRNIGEDFLPAATSAVQGLNRVTENTNAAAFAFEAAGLAVTTVAGAFAIRGITSFVSGMRAAAGAGAAVEGAAIGAAGGLTLLGRAGAFTLSVLRPLFGPIGLVLLGAEALLLLSQREGQSERTAREAAEAHQAFTTALNDVERGALTAEEAMERFGDTALEVAQNQVAQAQKQLDDLKNSLTALGEFGFVGVEPETSRIGELEERLEQAQDRLAEIQGQAARLEHPQPSPPAPRTRENLGLEPTGRGRGTVRQERTFEDILERVRIRTQEAEAIRRVTEAHSDNAREVAVLTRLEELRSSAKFSEVEFNEQAARTVAEQVVAAERALDLTQRRVELAREAATDIAVGRQEIDLPVGLSNAERESELELLRERTTLLREGNDPAQVERFIATLRAANEATIALNRELAVGAEERSFEQDLAALREQHQLLGLSLRERENELEVLEAIRDIQEEHGALTDEQAKRVRDVVEARREEEEALQRNTEELERFVEAGEQGFGTLTGAFEEFVATGSISIRKLEGAILRTFTRTLVTGPLEESFEEWLRGLSPDAFGLETPKLTGDSLFRSIDPRDVIDFGGQEDQSQRIVDAVQQQTGALGNQLGQIGQQFGVLQQVIGEPVTITGTLSPLPTIISSPVPLPVIDTSQTGSDVLRFGSQLLSMSSGAGGIPIIPGLGTGPTIPVSPANLTASASPADLRQANDLLFGSGAMEAGTGFRAAPTATPIAATAPAAVAAGIPVFSGLGTGPTVGLGEEQIAAMTTEQVEATNQAIFGGAESIGQTLEGSAADLEQASQGWLSGLDGAFGNMVAGLAGMGVGTALGTATGGNARGAGAGSAIGSIFGAAIGAWFGFPQLGAFLGGTAGGAIGGQFQHGGMIGSERLVRDLGTPRDNLLIRAEPGEFVVNREATARALPLLEAINAHQQPSALGQFQAGGQIGPDSDVLVSGVPDLLNIKRQAVNIEGFQDGGRVERDRGMPRRSFPGGIDETISGTFRHGGEVEDRTTTAGAFQTGGRVQSELSSERKIVDVPEVANVISRVVEARILPEALREGFDFNQLVRVTVRDTGDQPDEKKSKFTLKKAFKRIGDFFGFQEGGLVGGEQSSADQGTRRDNLLIRAGMPVAQALPLMEAINANRLPQSASVQSSPMPRFQEGGRVDRREHFFSHDRPVPSFEMEGQSGEIKRRIRNLRDENPQLEPIPEGMNVDQVVDVVAAIGGLFGGNPDRDELRRKFQPNVELTELMEKRREQAQTLQAGGMVVQNQLPAIERMFEVDHPAPAMPALPPSSATVIRPPQFRHGGLIERERDHHRAERFERGGEVRTEREALFDRAERSQLEKLQQGGEVRAESLRDHSELLRFEKFQAGGEIRSDREVLRDRSEFSRLQRLQQGGEIRSQREVSRDRFEISRLEQLQQSGEIRAQHEVLRDRSAHEVLRDRELSRLERFQQGGEIRSVSDRSTLSRLERFQEGGVIRSEREVSRDRSELSRLERDEVRSDREVVRNGFDLSRIERFQQGGEIRSELSRFERVEQGGQSRSQHEILRDRAELSRLERFQEGGQFRSEHEMLLRDRSRLERFQEGGEVIRIIEHMNAPDGAMVAPERSFADLPALANGIANTNSLSPESRLSEPGTFLARLHSNEAVIPLQGGAVPARLEADGRAVAHLPGGDRVPIRLEPANDMPSFQGGFAATREQQFSAPPQPLPVRDLAAIGVSPTPSEATSIGRNTVPSEPPEHDRRRGNQTLVFKLPGGEEARLDTFGITDQMQLRKLQRLTSRRRQRG